MVDRAWLRLRGRWSVMFGAAVVNVYGGAPFRCQVADGVRRPFFLERVVRLAS